MSERAPFPGPFVQGVFEPATARRRGAGRRLARRVLALLLLANTGGWVAGAVAQSAYVSDQLMLGAHAEASFNSAVVYTLESGSQVEVLERTNGLARIRNNEGVEGWVDERFLLTEAPAAVKLEAAEATLQAQQTAMKEIQGALAEVEKDSDRDFIMTAREAMEYGIIDSVIEDRKTGPTTAD